MSYRETLKKMMRLVIPAPAENVPCPKCTSDVAAGRTSCPRCGLLVARFARFRETQEQETARATPLDGPWTAVRASWQDAGAHDKLLDLAANLSLLPQLARRYRDVLGDGEAKDPIADKRIRQIHVLLEHRLKSQAREVASPRSGRVLWLLGYLMAGAVLLASAWVFYLALSRHG